MEERKTIFGYMEQVLCIFGFTIIILNIFCIIFGESAKEISQMFSLGGQGLSYVTVFQFLLLSSLITLLRFIFFTDKFIKNLSNTVRAVGMLASIIIVISTFIVVCNWFPINMWQPWLLFFICFGLSFIISVFVCYLKEKAENKAMEEALEKIKRNKIDD